jgi:hypothetical protein
MSNISDLLQIISQKLKNDRDKKLLNELAEVFSQGGSEALDSKIKEILTNIEEE